MRRPTSIKDCECKDDKVIVGSPWVPSQEQLDCTAPGGTDGYFPGKVCTRPEDCRGITSYNDLKHKPQINGVELKGNKSCKDLKLQCRMKPIANETIDNIFEAYS